LLEGMLSSYGNTDCSLVIFPVVLAEPLALVFVEEDLAFSLCNLGKPAIVATTAGWADVKDVGQVVVHTTAAGPGLTVSSESFDSAAGSQAPVCLADQWVWLWRHAKDAGLAKLLASLEVPGQVHFRLATDVVSSVFHWACFEHLVVGELLCAHVADMRLELDAPVTVQLAGAVAHGFYAP
jgi:hypothetical protein